MLPKQYHDAIEHWQRHNFPDYPKLAEEWDRFFPKDEPFCLCAKIAEDIPAEIEVGDRKGQAKALAPKDLPEEAAQHLLMQIKAQASTEFGSIQQHQGTLARAQEPQDHAWVLRVMAEELRHGYQMVHLLTSADWSPVTNTKAADMVEEILSMQTGGHVLDAFNLEGLVPGQRRLRRRDRSGRQVPAHDAEDLRVRPYGRACRRAPRGSVPPRGRRDPLAAGREARGNGYITMLDIQKASRSGFGRGIEMFGDDGRPDQC